MCANAGPEPSSAASTAASILWKIGTTDPALAEKNPLSKIPTLITDDGMVLYDSPVVCEYLDSIGDARGSSRPPGAARWKALQQEALGDGILDATQPRRRELALPQDEGRKSYVESQQSKVAAPSTRWRRKPAASAISTRSARSPSPARSAISTSATRTSLGGPGHPKLEAWYARVVKLPPMAQSMPPEG